MTRRLRPLGGLRLGWAGSGRRVHRCRARLAGSQTPPPIGQGNLEGLGEGGCLSTCELSVSLLVAEGSRDSQERQKERDGYRQQSGGTAPSARMSPRD